MLCLLWCLFLQDLQLDRKVTWEDRARPWMTRAEAQLYDSLETVEKTRFQGWFTARRRADAGNWTDTGVYLSEFFCPTPHGDIRDQIQHLFGRPKGTEPLLQNPKLPGLWRYADKQFTFMPAEGGRVRLTPTSADLWEKEMQTRVVNPYLKYDFRRHSFGRTRLVDDMTWVETQVTHSWWTPETDGGLVRLDIAIPETFKQRLRDDNAAARHHMELLVQLQAPGGGQLLATPDTLRHAGGNFDLLAQNSMTFQIHLPAGYYDSELLLYSGRLQVGLKARLKCAVRPQDLPRISDPIISTEYTESGITAVPMGRVDVGGQAYLPAASYRKGAAARVLVYSNYERTDCMVQLEGQQPRKLKQLTREGPWFVFELPPQSKTFRLLSLGHPDVGPTLALGAWGPLTGFKDLTGFKQNDHPNYLSLEELNIEQRGDLALLFVNGAPLAASRNGTFPWPAIDWGELAEVRFEYPADNSWFGADYQIRRNSVFQRVRVRPKYVVAGTRGVDNSLKPVDVSVTVVGQPAKITRKTPFRPLPKLWGIVVNDGLIETPAWPQVRDHLLTWLKKETGKEDMIYLVHGAERPELLVPPTTAKPVVHAAILSLAPRRDRYSLFNVNYLVDALTHLREHQTRPHQVIMLTDRLSDEANQMENLILRLRGTGLQLYNLEFPFEGKPINQEETAAMKPDRMELMKAANDEAERGMEGMRDSFMETRGTPSLYSLKLGKSNKNDEKARREERIRQDAFHDAFNRQLASMTAGMAMSAGKGEISSSLARFFSRLTQWQDSLVHLVLSVPYVEADMVDVRAAEGYIADWTLVEWQPE
ncbi:MAG: hypothetical protein QNK37_03845 [Acidobacteriota bacterium]|nr:hypothetical protein [Acidobacteriota bacterium]